MLNVFRSNLQTVISYNGVIVIHKTTLSIATDKSQMETLTSRFIIVIVGKG